MEWMVDTQLGRRNLPPAQRLAVMDKFKKKIQEQATNKANESLLFTANSIKIIGKTKNNSLILYIFRILQFEKAAFSCFSAKKLKFSITYSLAKI